MIKKPAMYSPQYAEPFKDRMVVEAYRHRPPYPEEVFRILLDLLQEGGARYRSMLDVGCGTGDIARHLVEQVERVDAVDFSPHMVERGKLLPHGDDPRLRWLQGRIEEVEDMLSPPYALVTAGESLHWMDWNVVLPLFRRLLSDGAYLSIVERRTIPDPWSILGRVIERYRTDAGYQPYDMVSECERHGLFLKTGEAQTAPVPFEQSTYAFIESYHSRSGFSRERMGRERASAFDREAREILESAFPDGKVRLQVVGAVVWGVPVDR